jgi:hypothetical protein
MAVYLENHVAKGEQLAATKLRMSKKNPEGVYATGQANALKGRVERVRPGERGGNENGHVMDPASRPDPKELGGKRGVLGRAGKVTR